MAVFCSELPKEWSQPHRIGQSASLRNPKCRVKYIPSTQKPRNGGRGGGTGATVQKEVVLSRSLPMGAHSTPVALHSLALSLRL